jgi:hypothetical protein
VNSLSYLAVLTARLNTLLKLKLGSSQIHPLPLDHLLLKRMQFFLEQFDPVQVRYDGAEWRRVWETVYLSGIQSQYVSCAD